MSKIVSKWAFIWVAGILLACQPTHKTQSSSTDKDIDGISSPQASQMIDISDNLFRHPSGNASTFILSRNAKALYDILLPSAPTVAEERAAYTLQRHLRKICNCSFQIVKGASSRSYISIGNTRSASRIERQENNLGEEGYEIQIDNKNLLFRADGPIGIVNASLAFLEEDLGVLWWGKRKNETYYPSNPNISVSLAARSSKPFFEYREPYFNSIQSKYYMNHNRLRASRGVAEYPLLSWQPYSQFPRGYKLHTFNTLVPGSEYADSHPEYYSEKKGKRLVPNKYNAGTQLCLSNHELASLVSKRAKQLLDEAPTSTKIHISQNDGGGRFCDCKRCAQINQKEGARSGSLIYFINRVADELKKSHPKVKVVTFAYKETASPPKHIRPRENVIVELCTDMHWGKPFVPISTDQKFVSALDGWQRLGTQLYIWEYAVNFSHFLQPWPNIEVTSQNLKFYRSKGVKGVLLQGPYQGNNIGAERALLKPWVWAKLMWNPDLDPQALSVAFTNAMFGKAAGPVNRYNQLLQKSWTSYNKFNDPKANYLPNNLVPNSLKLIKEARALTNDEVQLKHIAYWEASVIYSRLKAGPKNEQDIQAYNKDLDRFLYLCNTFQIKRLREQPLNKGSIDRYISDMRVKAENIRVKPSNGKTRFHEQGFFLPPVWSEEIKPQITKDPLAENNYAMSMKSSVEGWRMNLYVPGDYTGDAEYELNVGIRVDWKKIKFDPTDKTTQILQVFVYDEKTKGVLLRRFLYVDDLKDDRYIHLTIGNFPAKYKDRIVIAKRNSDILDRFYVDYIELKKH